MLDVICILYKIKTKFTAFNAWLKLIFKYLILQEGEEKKEKKKKVITKSVELPIESLTSGFSQVEINQYTEQEFKMIAGEYSKFEY